MKNTNIYLFLLIFLLLILITFFYHKNQIENFGNFSPYLGNNYNLNTYAKFKRNDERMLEKERYRWEKPFNCYNEGYYNAENPCGPPLVPIYSYPTLNFHRNEQPKGKVV
jgi:uncharacterized protein YxeA